MTLNEKLMQYGLAVGKFPDDPSWMACQPTSDYDLFVPNRAAYATGATPDEAVDRAIEQLKRVK